MRYACNILSKYDHFLFLNNLEMVLNNLFFTPDFMDLYFENYKKKPLENIKFDEKYLFELVDREKFTSITLRSKDSTGKDNWFRITLSLSDEFMQAVGKNYLFEWSKIENIDFLIKSDLFNKLIDDDRLIYCYCFNQNDVMEQSNKSYNGLPDKNIVLKKNMVGDLEIDISKNWGRRERNRSLWFVAAANIWFGKGFETVYKLDKFKNFSYTKQIGKNIYIELFDLYDYPNRTIQKEFWDYIIKNKIMANYK